MRAFIGTERRKLLREIIVPVVVATALAVGVGSIAFERIDQASATAREGAFVLESSEITLRIEERFKAYRQVLRGARALFSASEVVTRAEWRAYVNALRLQADYAGIQGVGFAEYISPGKLARHEQRVRAEGFPDYQVSPPGVRDEYSAIVLLEPFDWRNQRAFGYDMFSEPVRREAMERARELGMPALSGKVRLMQETTTDIQPGVLLYLPVFRHDVPLETEPQRLQAFVGWVYSPFRMGDLIAGTLGDSPLRLRIYDGTDPAPAKLLYDSAPEREPSEAMQRRTSLELDNRVWTLVFDAPGASSAGTGSWAEYATVVVIGALLVLLTGSFFAARQRASALDKLSASLRASEARYSTLVNLSQDGIAALDTNLCFTYLNPRLIAMLGYPEASVLGRRLDSLWTADDPGRRRALTARLLRGEAATYEQELRKGNGQPLTAIVTDAPHLGPHGMLQGVILTITDISERKASEQRIHYLATHDTLTGLANRAKFIDQMGTSLLLAMRHRTRFALLFLDLDHFKEVNDTLGHAAGDLLLIEAARRMQQSLRASDLLARQGGDEFLILLHDVHSMDEAAAVAEKIRQAIAEPFRIEGVDRLLSVSIGIALYPDDGADIETLVRHADIAMYGNKSAGRDAAAAPDHPAAPPGT